MVCVCGQHPQQTEEERPVAKFEATIAWSGRLEIILHFACIVVSTGSYPFCCVRLKIGVVVVVVAAAAAAVVCIGVG